MIKMGQMVLKGVNWVHNDKLGQIVLKGVIWVHNYKIRSNDLEKSQMGTQCKYRGYLLRQVVFHFTEKSMYFSV